MSAFRSNFKEKESLLYDKNGIPLKKNFNKKFYYLGREYNFSGFVAILAKAGSNLSGFRFTHEGKKISVSELDWLWRPKEIFGSPSTLPYQRIFGEIDFSNSSWEIDKDQNRIVNFGEELRKGIIKELKEISKIFRKISQEHRRSNLSKNHEQFLALDIDANSFSKNDFFTSSSGDIRDLFSDSKEPFNFPVFAKYRQIPDNEERLKDSQFFLKQLRRVYNEEIGFENSKKLFENSRIILKKLIEKNNRVGIMFGKIQSGKTYNYVGIIVNAFADYDFDICIIINGNNDDLYQQNKEAIERKINSIGAAENYQILEAKKDQGLDFQPWFIHAKRKNNKLIIFTLKHPSQLVKVTNLLSNQKLKKDVRVLIIDDEGDQASLNIKKIKKSLGDYYLSNNRSATNKSIVKLKNSCDSFFISVTATPYANLLIRKEDDLSPDFIEMISAGKPNNGKRYVGINDVFVDLREKLVRIIKKEEINLLDSGVDSKIIPPSLEKAISTFLLGSVITEKDSLEMWIHTHIQVKDHEIIKERINLFLDNLKKHLVSDKDKLRDFCNLGYKELLEGKKIGKGEEDKLILKEFKKKIEELSVFVINATKNGRRRVPKAGVGPNRILIGSKLLDRGISLNLTSVYVTIRAKNTTSVDTTYQRARWFGYRYENLLLVTRFWLSQEVENDYQEIKEMEEIFRQDVEIIDKKKLPLKDWGTKFYLPSTKLWITRKQIEQKRFLLTDHTQYAVMRDHKEEWVFWEKSKDKFFDASSFYHNRKHKEKEFDNFSDFVEWIGGEKTLSIILNKCEISMGLWKLIKEKAELQCVTPKVILMRPSDESKRTFIKSKLNKKLTINPFAGRDPSEKEEKYLGDEKLWKYSNNEKKIILQVWEFKLFYEESKPYKDDNSYRNNSFLFYNISLPERVRKALIKSGYRQC